MKKYFEGIRFGMILQLMIGPVCLFVFQTAKNYGFWFTFPLVIIVFLVDVFYITLACIGVTKLLEREKVKRFLKFFSSALLIIFGINTVLNVFGLSVIPGISFNTKSNNIILEGAVLAISNPLTIMFWSSFLTVKLVDDKMKKSDLFIFCMGLVTATFSFQCFVSLMGVLFSTFIPDYFSNILNILIGLFLIYFGINHFINFDKKSFKTM